MLGFDLFRGDKIKGQGISEFDDFSIRSNFTLKKLIPNFPFVPGSYSTERIERARKDISPLRRDETEFMAFLNTLGFKINKTNVGRLRTIKGFEFRRRVKGVEEQMRAVYNDYSRGSISLKKRNDELAELDKKYRKLSDKFSEDMGVPVDYQEGVPLSKIIPTITSALKKQTQELFGKN
tara:strand:- start:29 stop:565 length:537 start_codon:yes stop_codon:yes gene_type:complete